MKSHPNIFYWIGLVFITGLLVGLPLTAAPSLEEIAKPDRSQITFAHIARIGTAVASLLGIGMIIYLQFYRASRGIDAALKGMCFLVLCVLPLFILLMGSQHSMQAFKKNKSCMSCHQMQPFGMDAFENEQSTTLAARHVQNRWINENQCYSCHVGYGAAGEIQGKIDGLRHLYAKYTGSYDRPIRMYKEFPNANCLDCHLGGKAYDRPPIHRALHERIVKDKISCMQCHGKAHPTAHNRFHPPVENMFQKE